MTLGVPADAAVSLALSLTPATASRGTLSATTLTGTSVADLRSKISALTFTPISAAPSHCVNLDVLGNALVAGTGVCASTADVSNVLTSGTTTSGTGVAPVKVRALASFSQAASLAQESIYAIMTEMNSCATNGCHLLGHGGTGTVGAIWFVTPKPTDPNDTSTTYLDDTFTSATQTQLNGVPLVVPGNPGASKLYTAACDGGFDMMAQYFTSINSSQCHILYQWILEGAARN
jgi:hypothetical protein